VLNVTSTFLLFMRKDTIEQLLFNDFSCFVEQLVSQAIFLLQRGRGLPSIQWVPVVLRTMSVKR